MDRHKVLKFAPVKIDTGPATDVESLLVDAADENFTRVVLLGQDADGLWYFRCSSGIDKVSLMGCLEFIKQDIFASMGPV